MMTTSNTIHPPVDSPPTQLLALFLEHGTWPNWGPEEPSDDGQLEDVYLMRA